MMAPLILKLALFLILLAACGFIVYLVKQEKVVYTWSYRILLLGFILHTIHLGYEYYELGVQPVIGIKAALSFFSWAFLIFSMRTSRSGGFSMMSIAPNFMAW